MKRVPCLATSSISLEFAEISLCPSGPPLITHIGRELLCHSLSTAVNPSEAMSLSSWVHLPLLSHTGTLNNSRANSFQDLVTFRVLTRKEDTVVVLFNPTRLCGGS